MILWSIDLKSCFAAIICEQQLNQSVDTRDCERSKTSFTIYYWTIRIICYIKFWKYLFATCSLVFRIGFWIRCTIYWWYILDALYWWYILAQHICAYPWYALQKVFIITFMSLIRIFAHCIEYVQSAYFAGIDLWRKM